MCKADNLPPSCTFVTKSVNLKFLEPSGILRACNGTAIRFSSIISASSSSSSSGGGGAAGGAGGASTPAVAHHVTPR